jgi:hypothetical protein
LGLVQGAILSPNGNNYCGQGCSPWPGLTHTFQSLKRKWSLT